MATRVVIQTEGANGVGGAAVTIRTEGTVGVLGMDGGVDAAVGGAAVGAKRGVGLCAWIGVSDAGGRGGGRDGEEDCTGSEARGGRNCRAYEPSDAGTFGTGCDGGAGARALVPVSRFVLRRPFGAAGWVRAGADGAMGAAAGAGVAEGTAGGLLFGAGARTRLRAIRLPKTTRASPTWMSVPRIATWRSPAGPLSRWKARTRAPEMSWICLRPWPPFPTK